MTDQPTKGRGGRPATGTVITIPSGPHKGQLQGILTLADGSRERLPPFPRGTSKEMAKERTLVRQRAATAKGRRKQAPSGPAAGLSPGDEWWDAYFKHREAKGLSPTRPIYNAHLAPSLGGKHPRDWTREDCEHVVSTLDKKIASKGDDRISWKTAANAWVLFTKACKVASSAKSGELRVRSDNPCAGVEGPDRGELKAKQWLYPVEFAKLVSCPEVPLRWRRLYALLTYTYVRPGELRALDWSDVDLDAGTIHITKAWDHKRGRVKPPKTGAGVRHVPIETELRPLLEALHEESGGKGPVFVLPAVEHWARGIRRHLEAAGVTRSALFADTMTHKQITLYDLRATGITWRCLRKDHVPQVQRDSGHERYDTTDGYTRTASAAGSVGAPFPALPDSLLGGNRSAYRSESAQVSETTVPTEGLEPP